MNNELTNIATYDIQSLDNDELKKLFMSLRSKIISSQREMIDTKELEIIFCYVTREIQIRN